MKYTRGFLLSGQIITLLAFVYLTFSFFVTASVLASYNHPLEATISAWMGIFALVEVPISIAGIADSTRPYGHFRLWTPIVSMVFDIIIGILLFNGMSQTGTSTNALSLIFMIGVFASAALLIVGIVKGKKEMNYFHSHKAQFTNAPSSRPSSDASGLAGGLMVPDITSTPIPDQPATSPSAAPAPSRTFKDLEELKSLHDQHLITDEEYAEKRKDVLARAFASR